MMGMSPMMGMNPMMGMSPMMGMIPMMGMNSGQVTQPQLPAIQQGAQPLLMDPNQYRQYYQQWRDMMSKMNNLPKANTQ